MLLEFERSRVFRPRLLIRGAIGMGQQYLAGALLNHFEGLHVQSFDLPTLLSDSGRVRECHLSVVSLLMSNSLLKRLSSNYSPKFEDTSLVSYIFLTSTYGTGRWKRRSYLHSLAY